MAKDSPILFDKVNDIAEDCSFRWSGLHCYASESKSGFKTRDPWLGRWPKSALCIEIAQVMFGDEWKAFRAII